MRRCLILGGGLFCAIHLAAAGTLYVDPGSTNSIAPYTTWATAATNIQDAVDASTNGDLILVTNGVYATGSRANIGLNRIVVDSKAITIQSVNGPSVTIIQGFQDATTNGPAAMRCVRFANGAVLSGFTLTNGATSSSGGGIYCQANSIVTNCVITGNFSSADGGGGYAGVYYNCVITGNISRTSGGGVSGNAVLNNCLLTHNTARSSGGGTLYGLLTNCTLVANYVSTGGGGGAFGSSLNNCIVYYNTIGVTSVFATNVTALQTSFNNCTTTTNFPGSGNFTNAPLFMNLANGDYRLHLGSPCINAGSNGFVATAIDLDGRPRIIGGTVDVGAYENQFAGAVHYVQLSNTNPVSPYTSWITAATNIQDAVAAASDGDAVIADSGTYNFGGVIIVGGETNRVALTNAITLLSLNGAKATMIVGDTATRGVYVGDNAVLDGFTITNGHTRFSGDATNEQFGGGIWAKPTGVISNCILAGNLASATGHGGGAYGGLIFNSVFTNNGGVFGGGAAHTTLFNCTLLTNFTVGNRGGGLYSGVASNCVFYRNNAYGGGGGADKSTLYGCMVSNNFSLMGGAGATESTLMNCTVAGNSGYAGGTAQCTNYNCIIANNSGAGGGGGCSGGAAYSCIITGNVTSISGGGAFQATLNNCLLANNLATNALSFYGFGGGSDQGTLINCVLWGNIAANKGGGALSATLYNCTVISNSAAEGGGVDACTARNSIIYYNSGANGANYFGAGGLSFCCLTPPAGSSFTNEPLFVNSASGDFHLQPVSPCINSGVNVYVTNGPVNITTDFDGLPRIVAGTVDVGAFEVQAPYSSIPFLWFWQHNVPIDPTVDTDDPDSDHFNNFSEWRAGTDPSDALSLLQVYPPAPTNGAPGLNITWQSVIGKQYVLERGENLSLPFSVIQSNILAESTPTTFFDDSATNPVPYFYRVRVQ